LFTGLTRLGGWAGPGRIFVERSRTDFRTLLANCALSVSQGGYNTMMEVLDCGARAVVVPFAGGKETEQTMRAHLLAERGRIEVVTEDALAPPTLAAAIDRAAGRPAPGLVDFDLDGARKSAMLLRQWTSRLAW
jgi:predicted glycosyltransferase